MATNLKSPKNWFEKCPVRATSDPQRTLRALLFRYVTELGRMTAKQNGELEINHLDHLRCSGVAGLVSKQIKRRIEKSVPLNLIDSSLIDQPYKLAIGVPIAKLYL